MNAFTTQINNPSVKNVMGRVSRTSRGRMNALASPSTSAPTTAAVLSSTSMSDTRYPTTDSRAAVKTRHTGFTSGSARLKPLRFNLGVALEDLDRVGDAIEAYQRALRFEPDTASAHFNLSRLYEERGLSKEALRHLADYKRLV